MVSRRKHRNSLLEGPGWGKATYITAAKEQRKREETEREETGKDSFRLSS